MTNSLILAFDGTSEPALTGTVFRHDGTGVVHSCVRGNLSTSVVDGTFKWTRAVQALCVVLLKSKLNQKLSDCIWLQGESGSLASSIDYALSKEPLWLCEMFGSSSDGGINARRVILRVNSGLRRSGRVMVGLNQSYLPNALVSVYWRGQRLLSYSDLSGLYEALISRFTKVELGTSCKSSFDVLGISAALALPDHVRGES